MKSSFSQKITLYKIDSADKKIISDLHIKFPEKSNPNLFFTLLDIKKTFQKRGYIFSSIDSLKETKDSLYLHVFLGKKVDSLILIDSSNTNMKQNLSSLKEINQYLDNMLRNYNDSGYFLATVSLNSCKYSYGNYVCKMELDKGAKYRLDSIEFESESKDINIGFLKEVLNWDKIDFKHSTLSSIEKKLREITFLEIKESLQIKIEDSFAIIKVKVKEQKLNQFNAFLGILPNSYNTNDVTITGDVTLALKNIMKRGIELNLNWQKPQTSSQFLFTSASVPYLFKTRLGASALFSIEKFDTSFVRVIYDLGLNYRFSYNKIIQLFYKKQLSTILYDDTSFKITNKLPKILDYTYNQFGIQFKYAMTDRNLFPRKGLILDFVSSIGIKSIIKSNLIDNAIDAMGNSYSRLYDSIPLSNTVFYLSLNAENYILLSKRITLKSSINSKMLLSSNISNNEMFAFGGYRKPRGFDDNIFLSPYYSTLSNEFQYYFSEYFFTNVFIDVANYKDILASSFSTNTPISMGAGISIKTRGGIANVSLAYGKMSQQDFELKNGKIHFGYVSTF